MLNKGEHTKERIMDVAQRLVLQQGFSGTSIDEIIAEADITKGGFFYHFKGKHDLARRLLERYLEQDERFFRDLISKAMQLSENPLQQILIFLNLFAEAMADLKSVHPGCLVASYTYESHQFDCRIRELAAQGVKSWHVLFTEHFQRVMDCHSLKLPVTAQELANMLNAITEGGILLSRITGDARVLSEQILQFRSYVRLLFGDA